MAKTINLAYGKGTAEKTMTPVIAVHNGERIRAEYETLTFSEKPVYDSMKRVGDVVCAVTGLVVFAPLLLVTAAAIAINDFGNPICAQTRVGKNGNEFKLYKFRITSLDAKSSGKVTKVGAFLHKTAIDELPRLFNVLKGDMSIIGPSAFVAEKQSRLPSDRLLVKPGLSCYSQMDAGSVSEQIALDEKYIKERSVSTDIKMIGKTVLHVLGK